MPLIFEWDASKARVNLRRHGVSFDEARTVFDDPLAAIFVDEDHSLEEAREIIVGQSVAGRAIIACFTERARDRVRIFSARSVTARELKDYEEHL